LYGVSLLPSDTRSDNGLNTRRRPKLVKVKVKFTLEQTTKAPEGKYRYSSTLSLNPGAIWDGVNATTRPLYPGKDPMYIVQEDGWTLGPVWTGAENLAPHRDSIPGPSSP
jgi:hypothetical protein